MQAVVTTMPAVARRSGTAQADSEKGTRSRMPTVNKVIRTATSVSTSSQGMLSWGDRSSMLAPSGPTTAPTPR